MVLAVAIARLHDVLCSMRDHPTETEKDGDIANVSADPLIDGIGLVPPVGDSRGDFIGHCLYVGGNGRLGLRTREIGLPERLITGKRRDREPRTAIIDAWREGFA